MNGSEDALELQLAFIWNQAFFQLLTSVSSFRVSFSWGEGAGFSGKSTCRLGRPNLAPDGDRESSKQARFRV